MNNFYRSLCAALLFFGLLTFSHHSLAEKIITKENAENRMEIISSDYSGLEVLNTVSRINLNEVENAEGDVFTKLFIRGYTKNLFTGHPLLPVKREMIEMPASANAEIIYHSLSYRDYKLDDHGFSQPLFPLQPEHIKSEDFHEFVISQEAYRRNAFNEEPLVSIDELGYMRGTRIGRINIAPVQYNPATNTIRVYDEIRFSVNFTEADIPATLELKQKYYSPFFSAINNQLPNYQDAGSRENFMRYPVKYVIVSDPMFENMLQPFVEWKTKKGFTVVEAYTDDPEVGNTTTSIKAYLEDLYNSGTTEDPAPSFVLLVGDVDQIPAFFGNTGSHVTDLFYCEYTGDYFPEVYYGRFSAEDSADLQPQIDKTLQYEKYEMPDPSYLNEVVLVAGMDGSYAQDWGNGQINYGTENYFNADHGLTSQTYLYPESGSHSADIIQDISEGVSYGNYSAHCGPGGWGDPSFNVSDVPTLENQDKYGLLVGNCCQSNSFGMDECFGEALLRAGNKGALGYIGGSNNTMWDPDYYWGVGVGQISEDPPSYEETTLGAYDRMFHDYGEDFGEWYVTQDEMIFAGNLAVTEGTPGSAEYYWEIYHLMGDPSVMIYFSEPPLMTATYQEVIFIGLTTFDITTEPYAYVGLSMNGVLHGAGLADSLGNITLEIEAFTEAGEADLVITGQNRAPLITTVTVVPPTGPTSFLTPMRSMMKTATTTSRLILMKVLHWIHGWRMWALMTLRMLQQASAQMIPWLVLLKGWENGA
ncbi:MAG: C25 family cysteine peptidase [Bacteroidota bacterium]|nr:C25 family cysteine peptidase [Bacteroidota bacterium]